MKPAYDDGEDLLAIWAMMAEAFSLPEIEACWTEEAVLEEAVLESAAFQLSHCGHPAFEFAKSELPFPATGPRAEER